MTLRFWVSLQLNKKQNKKPLLTILVYIGTTTGKHLVPALFNKRKKNQTLEFFIAICLVSTE